MIEDIEKKFIIILGAIVLVIIIIGYGIGVYQKEQIYNQGYQQAWQEIKEKASPAFSSLPEEVDTLSGEVVEIKDQTLLVKIRPIIFNPLEEGKLPIRKVKIDSETVLTKLVKKTEKEFEMEQKEFEEWVIEGVKVSPPIYFKEISIDFDEFKVGDWINIESSENIKDREEFVADKITITLPIIKME